MNDLHDDARRTAEAVLKRDRRRIRWLGALTVGLWILAALLIASIYLPVGGKLKQFAQLLDAENPGAASVILRDQMKESVGPPIPPDQVPAVLARVQHETWIVSQIVIHVWFAGAIILAFALATGVLASICSVALALTIRRVTLRQVSEQLSEISLQLRELRGPETT